jgi:hypothetical protein
LGVVVMLLSLLQYAPKNQPGLRADQAYFLDQELFMA